MGAQVDVFGNYFLPLPVLLVDFIDTHPLLYRSTCLYLGMGVCRFKYLFLFFGLVLQMRIISIRFTSQLVSLVFFS